MTLSLNPSQPVRLLYKVTDSQGILYNPGIYDPGDLPSEFVNPAYCVGADGGDVPVVAQSLKFTASQVIKTWNNTPMSSPFTGPPASVDDPRWSEEIDFGSTVRGLYLHMDKLKLKNVGTNQTNFYLEVYQLVEGEISKVFNSGYTNGDRGVNLPIIANTRPFSKCKLFVDFIAFEPVLLSAIMTIDDRKIRIINNGQVGSALRYPMRVAFDVSRQGSSTGQLSYFGAQGMLTAFDAGTNSISYDWGGYSLSPRQKVKILATPSSSYTPPPGISYLLESTKINRSLNTLLVRGSIPPILGKLLRLRGSFSGLSNGAVVCFTESTQISPSTWQVKLSSPNGNLLNLVDTGSGRWAYLSYLESPELTVLSDNKLSLDGVNELDLFCEVQGFAATVTTGTPTQITWSNHGRQVGDLITLGISSPSGVLPGNVTPANTDIFVHSVIDVNTIRVCAAPNTPPINLGTVGSGVTASAGNNPPVTISLTAGTSATIGVALHGLSVGSKILLGGTGLPGGYDANTALYAQAVSGNSITPSAMPGGMPIAFLSAGSGVTLSGTNTAIDFCPISLSEYWLTAGSRSGEFDLRPTESGTPFAITSAAIGAITLRVLDPPTIESGNAVVFGFV